MGNHSEIVKYLNNPFVFKNLSVKCILYNYQIIQYFLKTIDHFFSDTFKCYFYTAVLLTTFNSEGGSKDDS